MDKEPLTNKIIPLAVLSAILLTALVLRIHFFVGLVSGDPQDDGIYYNYAMEISQDGFQYLEKFKNLPDGHVANPVDQFYFRPMVVYPIAFFFKCFGPSEFSASLWSLLCSMLTIIVAFYLGKTVCGNGTGLLGAFLVAIFPLDVISGTRILSDIPLAFFLSLSMLFFCHAIKTGKRFMFFGAGVCMGFCYLVKISALVMAGVFLLYAITQIVKKKISPYSIVFFLSGFLTLFLMEITFYAYAAGEPLLNHMIHHGACRFKYMHEPFSSQVLGPVTVYWTNGAPIYHLKEIFRIRSGNVDFFGYFYFLFIPCIGYSLYKRKNGFLVLFSVSMFLFFEFGFVDIDIDLSLKQVHYYMIFKQVRFFTVLTVPLSIIAACCLVEAAKKNKWIVFGIVLGLLSTSLVFIHKTHAYYRSGLEDLRKIVPLIEQIQENKDSIVWGDFWAVYHIRIFSGYRVKNLRILSKNTKEQELNGNYLLLGGGRGVELLSDYVVSTLPDYLQTALNENRINPCWRLLAEQTGKKTNQRMHDLRLYRLSCDGD